MRGGRDFKSGPVIGGRSKRPDSERYLKDAIDRGHQVLRRAQMGLFLRRAHIPWILRGSRAGYRESEPLLVEVQNALGIAYMRQGQFAKQSTARDRLWRVADQFYVDALRVNPNVVRVLQNQGSLRLLQGDDRLPTDTVAARWLYEQARQLYQRALEINPHDQFPHYKMAIVCAKLGDWECAGKYVESGSLRSLAR